MTALADHTVRTAAQAAAPVAGEPATVSAVLPDEAATGRLGVALAGLLRVGDVVTLSGDLGAGKTALARAVLRALLDDPEAEVPSPTFTLVQTYEPADLARPTVWHCDLYRLEDPDEVAALALDEALSEAALLVEWPDRLGSALPPDHLAVTLSFDAHAGPAVRRLTLAGHGAWVGRMAALAGWSGDRR